MNFEEMEQNKEKRGDSAQAQENQVQKREDQAQEAVNCMEKPVNRVEEPVSYAVEREKKQGEYTLEDYYAIPDDRRVELIDGVIYDLGAPSFVHQHLISSVFKMLIHFFDKKKGNCMPMVAPLDVNLDCDDRTMVQPDIVVLCDRSKIRKWGIYGAPDFCMEILSESTRRKDCVKKLQKYTDAGVKEYWILDPFRKLMMTYCWKDDYTPHMYPMEGSLGVELYDGELQIDLGALAELIMEYPE